MVNVENLLEKLAERAIEGGKRAKKAGLTVKPRRVMKRMVFRWRPTTVYEKILADWRREKKALIKRAREA